MRVAIALGLTLVAVLVGVVAALSAERPRLAGTNNVFDSFPSVEIAPGQEACARHELVPGDTAEVRVHAEPPDGAGGPITVRLVQGGREIARGSRPAGWGEGSLEVPIQPGIAATQPDVDVCFAHEGPGRIILWGYGAVDERRTALDGQELGERVRVSYLRPGRESGWDLLAAVARRMGVGRGSWIDGWAFYGWLATVVGALAVVIRLTVRELHA